MMSALDISVNLRPPDRKWKKKEYRIGHLMIEKLLKQDFYVNVNGVRLTSVILCGRVLSKRVSLMDETYVVGDSSGEIEVKRPFQESKDYYNRDCPGVGDVIRLFCSTNHVNGSMVVIADKIEILRGLFVDEIGRHRMECLNDERLVAATGGIELGVGQSGVGLVCERDSALLQRSVEDILREEESVDQDAFEISKEEELVKERVLEDFEKSLLVEYDKVMGVLDVGFGVVNEDCCSDVEVVDDAELLGVEEHLECDSRGSPVDLESIIMRAVEQKAIPELDLGACIPDVQECVGEVVDGSTLRLVLFIIFFL